MEQDIKTIIKTLDLKGFDVDMQREYIEAKITGKVPEFLVNHLVSAADGNDYLAEATIRWDSLRGRYHIPSIRAHVQRSMEVPDITINGINAKALDRRMNTFNWGVDFKDAYQHFFDDNAVKVKGKSPILAVLKDLWTLSLGEHEEGTKIRDLLMFKYLLETPFEKYHDLSYVQARYAAEKTYTEGDLPTLSAAFSDLRRQMQAPVVALRQPRKRILGSGKQLRPKP